MTSATRDERITPPTLKDEVLKKKGRCTVLYLRDSDVGGRSCHNHDAEPLNGLNGRATLRVYHSPKPRHTPRRYASPASACSPCRLPRDHGQSRPGLVSPRQPDARRSKQARDRLRPLLPRPEPPNKKADKTTRTHPLTCFCSHSLFIYLTWRIRTQEPCMTKRPQPNPTQPNPPGRPALPRQRCSTTYLTHPTTRRN